MKKRLVTQIDDPEEAAIIRLAARESRTVSAMSRILLKEALMARKEIAE